MYWWSRRNHPFQFGATFECHLIPIRNVIHYLEYIYMMVYRWFFLYRVQMSISVGSNDASAHEIEEYQFACNVSQSFPCDTFVIQWLNNFLTNWRNVNETIQVQKLRWNRKWNEKYMENCTHRRIISVEPPTFLSCGYIPWDLILHFLNGNMHFFFKL